MPFRPAHPLLKMVLGLLLLAVTAGAQQSYRGFTIDTAAVKDSSGLAPVQSAIHEQIDMVHAAGLPAEVLVFFQKVEFKVVPAGTFKGATPGRYTGRGSRRVEVSTAITRTGHKPVLLHELLHAYHDQFAKGGFGNPDIRALYDAARSLPAFAAKSHMMSNDREYFACTATTYLFGVTAQEPFSRKKIAEQQPACIEFLRSLFGADSGKYEGSLDRPPPKEQAPKP